MKDNVLLKDVVSTYFRKILYFDKHVIDRILSIMFVTNTQEFSNVSIEIDDLVVINKIVDFLSSYEGDTVSNDYHEYMNTIEHRYANEFYIYFLALFNMLTDDKKRIFNLNFNKNLCDIFYGDEIEALFNKEKFRIHFGTPLLGDIDISKELDIKLVNYIESNISSDMSELEIAIKIYYLLCKNFVYDPAYSIYGNDSKFIDYSKVNLQNNRVVCVQFAIIYYKFLLKYGIDANLSGDYSRHMFVNFRIGTMMLTADATMFGEHTDEYTVSDITATKYDFMIEGLTLNGGRYLDFQTYRYNVEKLEKAIKKFYKENHLRVSLRGKFESLIHKFQEREMKLCENGINKLEFDRRLEFVNSIFYRTGNTVEDMQMITKLIKNIFIEIEADRTELITLYKRKGSTYDLTRLLVLYDEDRLPYYYFLVDGNYVNYDLDTIINMLLDNGWNFRNPTDVDALDNEDERLLALVM